MSRLTVILIFMLSACVGDSPDQIVSDVISSDSTASNILLAASRTHIDQAVARLSLHDYARGRTVEVDDEAGKLKIRQFDRTHFSGPPNNRLATIVDTVSEGSGSVDFWKEYALGPTVEDTLEWGPRLLPGDPLVLAKQGPSYYQYRALGDTTIGQVRIARIEALLMAGLDRQGIQWAKFYVDTAGQELIGFELLFVHRSLLFDEESRFRYLLGAGSGTQWLPLEVSINTFLNLPLTKGQRFKLDTRYTRDMPDGGQ